MNHKQKRLVFSHTEPERIDKYLTTCIPEYSRAQIQRLIAEGFVLVNDIQPRKSGLMLEKNDRIDIRFPLPEPLDLVAEKIPLDILYEDKNVLFINKPAGMVVHPSAGHYSGTLVHAILSHLPDLEGIGGKKRPGIVHRLDKDTSGIILIAKNQESLRWLQRQFKSRDVEKKYIALVDGRPSTPKGRIIASIYRDKAHRKKMAIAPEGRGKHAETEYSTLKKFRDHTLLSAHPITGRTHQIRVHLSSIQLPIVGDKVYGLKHPSINIDRHFLHASEIVIRLPGEKRKTKFSAGLPVELNQILKNLKVEE
ncbi:MAG TPA: RluA family pseudouridine synthase [Pelolinea sp.]|nr:RluA family pseudouridine synthase [Pelolinea sp.]